MCAYDPMKMTTKILVSALDLELSSLGKPNEVWSLDAVLQDEQWNRYLFLSSPVVGLDDISWIIKCAICMLPDYHNYMSRPPVGVKIPMKMIYNQNLLYDTKILEGSTLYCKAHGGGKRCVFADCTKGAEGSTLLCKAHGGGKRCLHDGGGICPKSVHGGTNCCVAPGGRKMCTDCCVKHGGGKRCKSENCTKSAQGSTDFCKAHGGGKRCN
ncbi:hypothetical protein Tco_1035561 [Tanacetum coccineum]